MSYVFATPELMTAAATELAAIGSTVSEAQTAAAPGLAVIPAAADEVSVGVAQLFSAHAEGFQALAGKAAAFHEQFVQNLKASGAEYASIEDFIASLLQGFKDSVRSVGTALEVQILKAFRTVLKIWTGLLNALLSPDNSEAIIIASSILLAVAAFFVYGIIEIITETISGEV
jgi:PE family